jgi:dihydrolipoamide dehydrogenase
VPRRLLVIGAGAVGLELGSVWARLGAEVTVVEMLDRIVPGTDAELARALQRALEKQGLTFRLSSSAKDVDMGVFDRILVSVGRQPHVEGLGLEALGVGLDERGRIRVDVRYETSVPGIHAIGDVIPGPMLAHKASEEGIACVELMAGGAGHVNYEAIPNVVYTSPELATVGRTEEQCREAGLEVRVGRFPFAASGRARAMDEREGMVKIVADARTDRVLGVHVLGPRASELIAEATLAMEFGASAEDIARTSHAHPTLAETLREAALAVADRAIHT